MAVLDICISTGSLDIDIVVTLLIAQPQAWGAPDSRAPDGSGSWDISYSSAATSAAIMPKPRHRPMCGSSRLKRQVAAGCGN
jgi:hypothetical protein